MQSLLRRLTKGGKEETRSEGNLHPESAKN